MAPYRIKTLLLRLALALVLFAQLAVGAYAQGSASQLDAFGNPLCVSSVTHDGDGGSRHSSLPDCCTLGCGMLWTGLAPPDENDDLSAPLAASMSADAADRASETVATANSYNPQNPRAPPLTV